MNPYLPKAVYSTPSLLLRRVRADDADALLACYSDPEAVARMNADNCTSDFHYTTLAQMRECIGFWSEAMDIGAFMRFAVFPAGKTDAIGTVEMFGMDDPALGRAGVMRIDLASAYETEKILRELVSLGISRFTVDFDARTLLIKSDHTPERAAILRDMGFAPTDLFRPGRGYYAYAAER